MRSTYKAKLSGSSILLSSSKSGDNILCALPISVGQEYHENNKFSAAIDLVNKRFTHCEIIVCDSLQRHTLKIKHNISCDEAYDLSILQGDEWIKRNRTYYDRLENYNLTRWASWIKHPEFSNALAVIDDLYNNDLQFQTVITQAAHEYTLKLMEVNHAGTSYNMNYLICIDYLKEELAMEIIFSQLVKAKYILYPSKLPIAFEYFHKNQSHRYEFPRSMAIYFKKRKESIAMAYNGMGGC